MAVEGPLWWQIEHGLYRNTTLKKGSTNTAAVKTLQKAINFILSNRLAFPPNSPIKKLVVDGDFGQVTANAVWHFQHYFKGQYRTQYCTQYSAVDGICGPVTWKMMDTIIRKAQCS